MKITKQQFETIVSKMVKVEVKRILSTETNLKALKNLFYYTALSYKSKVIINNYFLSKGLSEFSFPDKFSAYTDKSFENRFLNLNIDAEDLIALNKELKAYDRNYQPEEDYEKEVRQALVMDRGFQEDNENSQFKKDLKRHNPGWSDTDVERYVDSLK